MATDRPHLQVQKLFLLTIVLKVGSSYLGWRFGQPWTLGFAAPLSIMALYVVIGLNRPAGDVSDEKFGDSCYYLGFIFTITSIIFSLFDLPDIGTRMPDIAVRFGAAMVSTVAGLVVRVYLVGFQRDAEDATREAEQAVIDAARRFHEQLVLSQERLRDFGVQVDQAARETVERVNLQVERLTLDHATKVDALIGSLAQRHDHTFDGALSHVRESSKLLGTVVDEVATQVGVASKAVTEAGDEMTLAMRRLRNKALSSEDIMEAVVRLASQQAVMLESARGQVRALEALEGRWSALDQRLGDVLARLEGEAGGAHASAPAPASAPVPPSA
jgi:hypothetical protein